MALKPLSDNSATIQVFDPILQPVAFPPLELVAPTEPHPTQEPPFDPVPDPNSSTSPADPTSFPLLHVYVRRRNLVPPSMSSPTVPSSSPPTVLARLSCPVLDPLL